MATWLSYLMDRFLCLSTSMVTYFTEKFLLQHVNWTLFIEFGLGPLSVYKRVGGTLVREVWGKPHWGQPLGCLSYPGVAVASRDEK